MACNCATKEEIDKLYKAYGDKLNSGDNEPLTAQIKNFLYKILNLFAWIIVLPFMFVYILLFLFWREPTDRNINVQNFNLLKIFHLKSYGRE